MSLYVFVQYDGRATLIWYIFQYDGHDTLIWHILGNELPNGRNQLGPYHTGNKLPYCIIYIIYILHILLFFMARPLIAIYCAKLAPRAK